MLGTTPTMLGTTAMLGTNPTMPRTTPDGYLRAQAQQLGHKTKKHAGWVLQASFVEQRTKWITAFVMVSEEISSAPSNHSAEASAKVELRLQDWSGPMGGIRPPKERCANSSGTEGFSGRGLFGCRLCEKSLMQISQMAHGYSDNRFGGQLLIFVPPFQPLPPQLCMPAFEPHKRFCDLLNTNLDSHVSWRW